MFMYVCVCIFMCVWVGVGVYVRERERFYHDSLTVLEFREAFFRWGCHFSHPGICFKCHICV